MDVCVCQNSWNCTLKICQVCVCKLYIKNKKKSQSGVRMKDGSAESKAEEDAPAFPSPSLSLQFIQRLLSHPASLLQAHTEGSRMELKGLISKEQLCPLLSLEMRKITPDPPRGIFFCSDFIQIPDSLLLKLNPCGAVLSEQSRRLL